MKKFTLLLIAALLFSCNDTDDEPTPTPRSLTITGVTITSFPGLNNGGNWDFSDGPDIYLVLRNVAQDILYTSTYYEDADPNRAYFFTPNVTIDPYDRLIYQLYDKDDFGPDQFMGGQSFELYDPDRPNVDTWELNGDFIDATIKVRQNF